MCLWVVYGSRDRFMSVLGRIVLSGSGAFLFPTIHTTVTDFQVLFYFIFAFLFSFSQAAFRQEFFFLSPLLSLSVWTR